MLVNRGSAGRCTDSDEHGRGFGIALKIVLKRISDVDVIVCPNKNIALV